MFGMFGCTFGPSFIPIWSLTQNEAFNAFTCSNSDTRGTVLSFGHLGLPICRSGSRWVGSGCKPGSHEHIYTIPHSPAPKGVVPVGFKCRIIQRPYIIQRPQGYLTLTPYHYTKACCYTKASCYTKAVFKQRPLIIQGPRTNPSLPPRPWYNTRPLYNVTL